MTARVILSLGLLLTAGPVLAQESDATRRAGASLTIERPVTVAAVRPMTFSPIVSSGVRATVRAPAAAAIIQVTGDPGRVYTVTLPAWITDNPELYSVGSFTVISENSGDITQSLTAQMNAEGSDRIEIRGLLLQADGVTLTNVTTAVPVNVDYE